jgi:hypothetical protein
MKNRGFIAMTLVIGIGAILLAFTFLQSIEIFHFFDLTERKQYRLMNYYNAYNCIDRVMLNLSHDYFYEIKIPFEIKELNCSIDLAERVNNEMNIETTGIYKGIFVKRKAKVRIEDEGLSNIFIE